MSGKALGETRRFNRFASSTITYSRWALLTFPQGAGRLARMMIFNLPARRLLQALCLAGGFAMSQPVLAQGPPSGEAPRMAPRDTPGDAGPSSGPSSGPDRGKAKEPVITLANRQAMLGALYDQLASTHDPEAAKPVIEAIWKVWTFSGSATSDVLLERARASAAEQGGETPLKFLNAIVELQPDFAQAWFLRAMVYKLQNDSHRMLGDLRRTLALDPRHFEALKALAFELNERGEKKTAMEAYGKLLQTYPAAAKSDDPILEALTRDLAGQGI